uniref:Uncharacterized protein n=1 Tax=Rhizophora mucronata TaxID=61149 RepID=A0A2P2MSQ2_RHIMU
MAKLLILAEGRDS